MTDNNHVFNKNRHDIGGELVRQRLGLIVPSSNTVMEVDFYRNLPDDITLHVSRMYLRDTTVAGEEEMLDKHFPRALEDIATVMPHAIVFGCTSAGALRGNKFDSILCQRIAEVGNCYAISTIASARKNLKEKGLQRIAVITPYIEKLNQRVKFSLEEDGLDVVLIAGLGIDYNFEIAGVDPEQILSFSLNAIKDADIDGIFISCTNFRGMEAMQRLEDLTGLPVVTSNQAAMKQSLKVLSNSI